MRILIPQKQLDLYRRNLLFTGDLVSDPAIDQNDDLAAFMTPAEQMCQELLRLWREVKNSHPNEVLFLMKQVSEDGTATEGFLKELDRLSQANVWKSSKVDIALCHEIFNLVDECLEMIIVHLSTTQNGQDNVDMIDTSSQRKPLQQPVINHIVTKVLKFLRISIVYATNIQYFNSYERISALFKHFKLSANLNMIYEIVGVQFTLSSKQNEKRILTGVASSNKPTTESFNEMISQVIHDAMGYIKCFHFLTDLLIVPPSQNLDYINVFTSKLRSLLTTVTNTGTLSEADLETILGNRCDAFTLETKLADKLLRSQVNVLLDLRSAMSNEDPRKVLEESYPLLLRQVALYLNVGDMSKNAKDKYTQTTLLEQLIPPKPFVRKLLQVLQTEHLAKKLHIQTLRNLFPFVILDMNQMFSYIQPMDNQYYVEACNHHEYYIKILQRLARWHGYSKIKEMKVYGDVKPEGERSSLLMEDEGQEELERWLERQRELVDRNESEEGGKSEETSETIKSQAFLHRFLNYLFHLLNFKNRTLQTQLYPQFLKPLLAIINVRPTSANMYPINISCQQEAVRLLKEVVKVSSLDDPGAVEIVIHRLKDEIKNLHAVDIKWEKFQDDDHELELSSSLRHEIVRTYLRFLSYSIIRNDPNAINFTQNFVANSRKILDSGLLQNDMMRYIFEPNKSSAQEDFLKTSIDPVILQCIQLVSYLFNDLPQKIPQFIDNGFFGSLLESLAKRVPVQADLISLIMKLVQTLCLNSQGADLAVKSGIMEAFARVACDFNAHKQFVNPNKVQAFSEVIQNVLGQSKELAEVFLKEIVKNYHQLIDRAWEVTRKYIEMEKKLAEQPALGKIQKDLLRMKYEKQQISLEQTFEAQANLLFFYIDLESAGTNTNTQDAVKKNKDMILDVFDRIITTPLVASACSSMFPPFIEAMFNIFSVFSETQQEVEISFLEKALGYIRIQLDNLSKLLKTSNFDQVYDIEKSVSNCPSLALCERNDAPEHTEIIAGLKPEDLASVVFGKIKFYCEIIAKSQSPLSKQKIFSNPQFLETAQRLFKLQSLINRYHACIYERIILKDHEKLRSLMTVHKEALENTDFTKFTPFKTPIDEEEKAKNLYFKYHVDKVQSLTDERARESFKSTIELALDENISHTSNLCQHAIRRLLNGYLRYLNRQKTINFETDQDPKMLEFNQMIGGLIAEEFLDFRRVEMSKQDDLMSDENYDIRVMRYYCQLSATFAEFNKVLFGNYSNGIMMVEFIERGGLECIKEIVVWMIKYIKNLEQNGKQKTLDKCKNIQLLWSHVIDFFIQLIEGKYIEQQFQTFLIAFRPNPAQGIKGDGASEEMTKTFGRLKDYFMSVILSTSQFFFVELNQVEALKNFKSDRELSVFDYFNQISEIFLVSLVDIYGFLSRGLTHIHVLNNPPGVKNAEAKKEKAGQNKDVLEQKLRHLVEMGFEEAKAKKALEIAFGDTEVASELLIQNLPDLNDPIVPGALWEGSQQESNKVEEEKKGNEIPKQMAVYHQEKKFEIVPRRQLFKIIAISFKDYLNFSPSLNQGKLIKKSEVIENMFFRLGSDTTDSQDVHNMLHAIKEATLDSIRGAHLSKDLSSLGHLALCLEHLLSYRHGQLVNHKEVFDAIFEIMALFQMLVQALKEEITHQPASGGEQKQEWGKPKHRKVQEMTKQIEKTIQLFMYITEEGKISSDLGKLANILGSKEKVNTESMPGLEIQLDALNQRNQDNIFHQHKEQTAEVYHKITLLIIDLFKAMHSMDPQVTTSCEQNIQELILRGLEILNFMMNIKGFSDFDCQMCFLQNEGLRALFCIRLLSRDTIYFSPMGNESKKLVEIQIQSKVLLQMLSQNEHTQMRIYENLIKSVLFIYFQEKYKAKEGQDISKEMVAKQPDAGPQTQSQLTQHKSFPPNKGKGGQNSIKHAITNPTSPQKKLKEDPPMTPANKKSAVTPGGNAPWKQSLLKKIEYGEIPLEDFIHFFNNVMQIQDFRSFLQACTNVCIIKKKPKKQDNDVDDSAQFLLNAYKKATQNSTEEKKDDSVQNSQKSNTAAARASRAKKRREKKEAQELTKNQDQSKNIEAVEEEYYIVLNYGSMKEMLNQYEANNSLNASQMTHADTEKFLKGHLQKFQQEIVFTILDLFIEQIRDQQLLILQHSKQKLNPSQVGLESRLDKHGQLVIKNSADQSKSANRLSYQLYLFDTIQLLSHFTFMSTHSPILIHSLLRHKDGKTFKFIIRNLYFLMTMVVDETDKVENKHQPTSQLEKEFTVWFDHMALFGSNKKRIDIINEFFKRVMFDNPHLTHQERKAKFDARVIFQKEVLKNLCENAGSNHSSNPNPKFPLWPNLRIIFNLGAVWLMSVVFSQETLKPQAVQDKQIESIVVSMQKYRNIYRNTMIKNMIHDCQHYHMKGLTQKSGLQALSSDTTFALLSYIQLIQSDVKDNLNFFESQKDPINICITSLHNLLYPFEGTFKVKQSIQELGFISKSTEPLDQAQAIRGRGRSPAIHEEESEPISSEEEDEDMDEDEDDDDSDEEDDQLMDSDLSEPNYRFSQHDLIEQDDGAEDGEEDYGSEDEFEGSQRGRHRVPAARRNHHLDHQGDDFTSSQSGSDSLSNDSEDIDGGNPAEIQIIQDILNRGPSQHELELLDDYGNEDDEDLEDDDEDLEEELDDLTALAGDLALPSTASRRDQDVPIANQLEEEKKSNEDANMEEDYADEDYDAEYDDEEELEDEDDGYGDEEYGQEMDDGEQEEVQIYIGRNPEMMERLSNQDIGFSQQRLGAPIRRDDLLSLNNMSMDMFNARIGSGHIHHHHHHHDHSDNVSADFSSDHQDREDNISIDQQSQQEGIDTGQRQNHPIGVISQQRLGGVDIFNDLVGLIMGSQGSAARPGSRPATANLLKQDSALVKEDLNYKPVQTMLEIVSLGKEMQRNQNIYKQFIKELVQEQQPKVTQQTTEQINTGQASSSDTNVPEHQSTKSQFSGKNPFEGTTKEQDQKPIFGQFDPRSLSGLAAQPIQQQPPRRQQPQPLDDIELDPEFVENLDQTGLQNIADSENMMRSIQIQSNRQQEGGVYNTIQLLQSISSREERARVFRNMPQEAFNELPANLYTEGMIYRRLDQQTNQQPQRGQSLNDQSHQNPFLQILRNLSSASSQGQIGEIRVRIGSGANQGNGQGNWNQVRSRLHSMDQQINDITDFSLQPNDPYIQRNPTQVVVQQSSNNNINNWISQTTRLLQSMTADKMTVEDNSIYITFNQYLQNHIEDMRNKPVLDNKGTDLNQACESLIQSSLLRNLQDVNEQSFQQLNSLLEMIMTWVKLMNNGIFNQETNNQLMEILYTIPNVRVGLLVKTMQWMIYGFNYLQQYNSTSKDIAKDLSTDLENFHKAFSLETGSGLTGKITVHAFVLQCLKCFEKVTSSGEPKKPSLHSLDFLKIPKSDSNFAGLIDFCKKNDIPLSVDDSLLTQLLDNFVTFFNIVNRHPIYFTGELLDEKDEDIYWDDILGSLAQLLKQIAGGFRLFSKQGNQMDQLFVKPATIQNLCCIILSREFKTKASQKKIRTIFNEVSVISGEGQTMVEELFKTSLKKSLKRFVSIIEESKIDIDELKKEVVIINQILKFSKSTSTNDKSEANICEQTLFFNVVKAVSDFIDRKQIEHVTSSLQQAGFMFKEDFRQIMTTLFILFEFNLKSIFTESQDQQPPGQPRPRTGLNSRRSGPRQRNQGSGALANSNQEMVIMDDPTEIKQEMEHEIQSGTQTKDRQSLMQAIDKHLQIKIKDEFVRKDERLKVFITFCLEHKKVINSFIRANQQILNESLRNVIIKVPQVLDFDNKRLLFRTQIKQIQKKYRMKYFDIQVRRDHVFDDSYDQLKHLSPDRWKGKMNVEFQDEQGIDEGGLTKEWFILLSQGVFNPDLALFLQSNAGSTYYPNPKSTVDPEYQQLFKFIGRIVGKAIYEQQLLDCYFVKAFYKIILGMPLNYHDVEDYDNELYKNLKWCLENSVESLGFVFSETVEYFGDTQEIEIVPGGKEKDVTDENKYDYVQKMALHKLYNSVKKQIDNFLLGFYEIVPKQLVQIFDNRELELLISGLPNIDIMDLKENTVYQNYTAETQVVRWLFEVLEEFDNSERAEFIQFVTGSSKVPVEGFKGLRGSRGLQKFQIVKFFTNDNNRLPQAHTCFKQLELPEYTSKEKLKERLLTAIKEGKNFGFA